jgi:hypothetical protein
VRLLLTSAGIKIPTTPQRRQFLQRVSLKYWDISARSVAIDSHWRSNPMVLRSNGSSNSQHVNCPLNNGNT